MKRSNERSEIIALVKPVGKANPDGLGCFQGCGAMFDFSLIFTKNYSL
jgi:hypothetical protein